MLWRVSLTLVIGTALFVQAQDIFFNDNPPPPQNSQDRNPAGRRPQFRPFQTFNLNNIVRNPIGAIASGLQSFANIVNPTPNTPEPDYGELRPDCRTFRNTEGYCMPLDSCDSLSRILANRPRGRANRILRRSISSRTQDQNPPTRPPFSWTTTRAPFRPRPTSSLPFQSSTTRRPSFPRPTPRPTFPQPTFAPPTPRPTFPPRPTRPPPRPQPNRIPRPDEDGTDIQRGCGFSNASHSRIVGGKEAQKGAWPWIAALGFVDATGKTTYLCGGALISNKHILTAGHCSFNRKDLKTVRLGDHDLYSDSDGVTPLNMAVEEVIISPDYNPKTYQNDIAIIRLRDSVDFTLQVHPICLPNTRALRGNRFENKSPFVAGWGAIEFNGPTSAVLRETQLPVVRDSECQAKFKRFKNVQVDDTNICAGLQRGGRDTCQGDSGGPLMQPINSVQYVQIGVVSFGFKCAEPGYPGVYTRVTHHMDWIEKTLRNA